MIEQGNFLHNIFSRTTPAFARAIFLSFQRSSLSSSVTILLALTFIWRRFILASCFRRTLKAAGTIKVSVNIRVCKFLNQCCEMDFAVSVSICVDRTSSMTFSRGQFSAIASKHLPSVSRPPKLNACKFGQHQLINCTTLLSNTLQQHDWWGATSSDVICLHREAIDQTSGCEMESILLW